MGLFVYILGTVVYSLTCHSGESGGDAHCLLSLLTAFADLTDCKLIYALFGPCWGSSIAHCH